MRVLLINPPYQTLTSNLGVGHQVPLGLLMVGGALTAEHEVRLLDAEALHLRDREIVDEVRRWGAQVVLTGHAGSTPAHPVCARMLDAIRRAGAGAITLYGGVYPSYHAAEVLSEHPGVDFVVRGEGEATAAELVAVLARGGRLDKVTGISFRDAEGRVIENPERAPIADLDACRAAWELIGDWDRYRCFGLGRSAILQYSRGCPHRCTYCGQHGFWVKWRRRSVRSFVDETERLHREHGVRFITLADENPTTLQREWRRLLEELAARRLDVRFFATIRAGDIVRDADFLDLYREAGILYVLMGIESTDDAVLRAVDKRSDTLTDYRACRLLRDHGIFSMIGHIVGLGDESWADFRRAARVLARYDGDLLNAMYVTPHAWTRFAAAEAGRCVVQTDQRRWDYRHQVLEQSRLSPWQLFLAVKWLELRFHLRPRRLWRIARMDAFRRRQMLWCMGRTGMVWLGELLEYLMAARHHAREPRSLDQHCDLADRRAPLRVP